MGECGCGGSSEGEEVELWGVPGVPAVKMWAELWGGQSLWEEAELWGVHGDML